MIHQLRGVILSEPPLVLTAALFAAGSGESKDLQCC
jgi:hypothetical protein